MKSSFKVLALAGAMITVASCAYVPPQGQAYWQRVEDNSALYMTGPKAQQTLEENIALCVHEVDEMVELDGLKKAMPPDTHSEYHRALDASGDMAFYDTPTRYGDKKIANKDFQDFEGCMRHQGWERVRFIRYTVAQQAKGTYGDAQALRKMGLVPGVNYAVPVLDAAEKKKIDDFQGMNK